MYGRGALGQKTYVSTREQSWFKQIPLVVINTNSARGKSVSQRESRELIRQLNQTINVQDEASPSCYYCSSPEGGQKESCSTEAVHWSTPGALLEATLDDNGGLLWTMPFGGKIGENGSILSTLSASVRLLLESPWDFKAFGTMAILKQMKTGTLSTQLEHLQNLQMHWESLLIRSPNKGERPDSPSKSGKSGLARGLHL